MNIETRAKGVSDVFKAYPVSVFEFFAKAGQGLYIPAYQRPYSWDKANIDRLIEDTSHGFRMLVSQADAVTFLGTIIAINDTQHKTISPLVKGQVPSRVMTIIDGQQRLTTLLVLNIALHEHLRLGTKKLKHTNDDEVEQWLMQEVQRQLAELKRTFEEDQGYGAGSFQFYPRMIRSFVDQWSTQAIARYASPIAWYLHKYGEHVRATEASPTKFTWSPPPGIDDQLKNAHQAFSERTRTVQRLIKVLSDGPTQEDEGVEAPRWSDVVGNTAFQQALSNQVIFPDAVRERVLQAESDFHKLLRTLLFSRFLLTRVALTIVEATNEDSAFDLFEALNTTGEPLTAYETFKPKVIQQEALENLETSKSYACLTTIDQYLSDFTKTDEKQDATRGLVVSFALAETGEKLSRHLSDQRRYLRDRYETLDGAEKLAFVTHLARCSVFHREVWPKDAKAKPVFGEFDIRMSDLARICVDFLRQSNHTITIAPLIRFYSAAVESLGNADPMVQKAAVKDFDDAVKAVAAFWTLWRASRPGTDNIDSYYRALMQAAGPVETVPERFLALSRRPNQSSTGSAPEAAKLKDALCRILRTFGKIESKDAWVTRATTQLASKTKAVTRFLLLVALHDSPADVAKPGLNEVGTPGSAPLLGFETWQLLQTLEHVAPGRPESGADWDPVLYAEANGDLIETLGNLTLLPHSINASVSNRSWRSKQFLYRVLASPTQQAADALLAKAADYAISPPTTELLETKATYMAQVDALARVQDAWTPQLVRARGVRLAELAWGKLAGWLDWDKP